MIGALARDGLCAAMAVAAATSTAVFRAFVEQALIPVLLRGRPDAIVVMDNLAAHKAAIVRKAFDRAKARRQQYNQQSKFLWMRGTVSGVAIALTTLVFKR